MGESISVDDVAFRNVRGWLGRPKNRRRSGWSSGCDFFRFFGMSIGVRAAITSLLTLPTRCGVHDFGFCVGNADWPNRHWIAFAVTTSWALATHYFSGLVAVVLWGWVGCIAGKALVAPKSDSRPVHASVASILLAGLTGLILTFPVLLSLRVDLATPPPAEVVNAVDMTAIAYLYLSLAQGWCLGPSSLELQALPIGESIRLIGPWAILSLGASACLIVSAWRSEKRRELTWLIGLLVIPVAIAAGLSYGFGFSFVSRYLACLIVPVALVVSLAMQRVDNRIAWLALILLLLLNCMSFFNRNANSRYDRENYRLVVEEISKADSNPCVLVLSHYVAHAVQRVALDQWRVVPVSFYSDDPPESSDSAPEMMADRFADAWIIAEWFPEQSALRIKRDLWLERAGAVPIERVSNSLEIFRLRTSPSTQAANTSISINQETATNTKVP